MIKQFRGRQTNRENYRVSIGVVWNDSFNKNSCFRVAVFSTVLTKQGKKTIETVVIVMVIIFNMILMAIHGKNL